jgi:hypothetical protein
MDRQVLGYRVSSSDQLGNLSCQKNSTSSPRFASVRFFASVSRVESDDDIGPMEFLERAERHCALIRERMGGPIRPRRKMPRGEKTT